MKSFITNAILIITLNTCASFAMASLDEPYPENEFKCHVKRSDLLPDIVLIQTTTLQSAYTAAQDLQIRRNGKNYSVLNVIECTVMNDSFSDPVANDILSKMPL